VLINTLQEGDIPPADAILPSEMWIVYIFYTTDINIGMTEKIKRNRIRYEKPMWPDNNPLYLVKVGKASVSVEVRVDPNDTTKRIVTAKYSNETTEITTPVFESAKTTLQKLLAKVVKKKKIPF